MFFVLKKIIISLSVGLCAAILLGMAGFAKECGDIRGNVLRLHVLASSDSNGDQTLKLKVRDRIIAETSGMFGGAGASAAKEEATAKLDFFREIAQDELRQNDCYLPVKTEIVNMYFATKKYGELTMPAGRYDAVRVIIGEGEGQNWWCVMFPPLCLPAAEHPEQALDVFSDNQREIISSQNYEIGFKTVEVFESIKEYFGWK